MQTTSIMTTLRIDKDLDLPSIPLVVARILQAFDDERLVAKDMEDLILHDQSLSARILRLSNSAFYSFRNEVRTISQSVTLLGTNLVKGLIIGVQIFDAFTKDMKTEAKLIHFLWMHSFGVGLLTQQIWAKRSSKREGEFAFLCGLLHDLGKVVYFKKDPVHYGSLFTREIGEDDPGIETLELREYGIDHAMMGYMIVDHWNLPKSLGNVLRDHHHAMTSKEPIVAAVAVADQAARRLGIGFDGDREQSRDLEQLMVRLRMDSWEFENLLLFGMNQRSNVEDFFASGSYGEERYGR